MDASCGVESQGNAVGDRQAVAFERHNLARVVGENAKMGEAEIDQDLRADAAFVLQQPLPRGVALDLAARMVEHARHFAGPGDGLFNAEAAAGLVQVHEDAAILAGNGGEPSIKVKLPDMTEEPASDQKSRP